jgi:ATP-dependent Lon protease
MEVVNFAAEGRKRVKEQLYKIDETFKAEPAMFEYEIRSNGEKRQIKTLEELGRTEVLVEDGNLVAEITQASVGKTENEAAAEPKDSVTVNKPVAELGPKHIHVVANQRGVSFRSLFGDYLKGAHKIVVVDPFIMKPYQIDNLIDLMQLVLDMNATSEEDLRIELHTKIDEMKPQEQNAALESLREELATEGVEFEFTFDATHDRGIFVDDKWAISLGRGLDIYDWFDRHSLKRSSQRMRKCRDFQMSIAPIQRKE